MKYDLVVVGGGTSGIAVAYIASKYGLKTLLIEKTDVLGGAITRGLVMPCMKLNTGNINIEFINDLKKFADKYKARHRYIDGNEYWFNSELLKIAFDDMLTSVKCNVLFNSDINIVKKLHNSSLFEINAESNMLSLYIETKYIVDATSNGKIFKILNCNFQKDNENTQAATLRFMISGIDMQKFAKWLEKKDKDRSVTTIDYTGKQIHLSTAYTWDISRNWALAPIFAKAINDNVLEYNDTAYFQLFTVPNMPNTVNLNAPRIILSDDEDLKDPFVYSRALKQGRERIFRVHNFCTKYFPGFENSFISHISDMLGIRESYRVKCRYTFSKDDIISVKQFENIAFTSDYPIDIHSNSKAKDKLKFSKNTYNIPLIELLKLKSLHGSPGPGAYELSQTFIKPSFSSTSIMENKAERFIYKENENPGPGSYQNVKNLDLDKQIIKKNKEINYEYFQEDTLKERRIKNIIEFNKRGNEVPGSGTYNIDERNSILYKICSKFNPSQSYHSPFMNSSGRFKINKKENASLSPTSYAPYEFEKSQKNNKYILFNKALRFNGILEDKRKNGWFFAGPGSYNLTPTWNKKSFNILFSETN